MTQLREIRRVRQVVGESPRRWFTSKTLDLIVWLNREGGAQAFQLCYDKGLREHAITWDPVRGYGHRAVDDGEQRGFGYKGTPVLVADGVLDADRINGVFLAAGKQLPRDVVTFVAERLRAYPQGG